MKTKTLTPTICCAIYSLLFITKLVTLMKKKMMEGAGGYWWLVVEMDILLV